MVVARHGAAGAGEVLQAPVVGTGNNLYVDKVV